MRPLSLSRSARAARNAACIALADEGDGNASIRLYTASGGTLLAVRRLAKPCCEVRAADGRLLLLPAPGNDDVVLASGGAAWGEWCAADGTVLASGQVTDEEGYVSDGALPTDTTDTGDVGPWVLSGTQGTRLYAGGLVLLTAGVIG
jgi:hypothetical protein